MRRGVILASLLLLTEFTAMAAPTKNTVKTVPITAKSALDAYFPSPAGADPNAYYPPEVTRLYEERGAGNNTWFTPGMTNEDIAPHGLFGGSWANFADMIHGNAWTGKNSAIDPATGMPIDADVPLNLSGYETSPGLSGRPVTHSGPVPTTVKIGSGKMVAPGRYTSRSGDPLEVRANGDVVNLRTGYVAKASGSTAGTGKTPGMAAYDAHQAAFYSDVPKSLISGSSRSRSPAEREADLIARWQRKNPGVEMPADILAQIRQNSKGDHRQTVQSGPSPMAQPTGQPRRSEPIPRQRPTPMLPRQPDQTSSSGQGPGEGVRRSTPMLPVLQDIKRRFLGG